MQSHDALEARLDPARDQHFARRAARDVRPGTPNQLHAWVRIVLGFDVPRIPIAEGSDAPFDYLCHAYFEDRRPRDCVVWANRGGGKTQLGAIATLLDLLFKPGVQVRILGGSFEQSSRMYAYLRSMLDADDLFKDLLSDAPTGRRVTLRNGSMVEVLSQSERAVRGQRVHKLRCDEVELFEPDVWRAAQLITRSGMCGDVHVHGAIETMSTMHRPFGLMQRLIDDQGDVSADHADGPSPVLRRVFRWSVLDVLERCPPRRPCEGCALWDECGGRARQARGFVRIDDVIQQKSRVGWDTWQSEMLCDRPRRSDAVYPYFSDETHVRAFDAPSATPPEDDDDDEAGDAGDAAVWIGGLDFGYRAPTVLLWAFVDGDDVLHIVDELVARGCSTEQIIKQVRERPWPEPAWIGADPAGHQVTEHLGRSLISQWREAGVDIRTRFGRIDAGVAAVARRIRDARGVSSIMIHQRCTSLVESLALYRYPDGSADLDAASPVKDGADHAADALRYMVVNLDGLAAALAMRQY